MNKLTSTLKNILDPPPSTQNNLLGACTPNTYYYNWLQTDSKGQRITFLNGNQLLSDPDSNLYSIFCHIDSSNTIYTY